MAISIGELRGIISLQDSFSGPANQVAKGLGFMSESFGAVTKFAGLTVGAITGATAAIVALGTHGADVADVRAAFEGLTQRAGESAAVMLGELQKGTLGTINNFELMKLANTALGTGLVKSSADMGTLASGAKLLADRTGGDTAEAFKTLTSAMATGRTGGLKQLGLFVDTKVAVENYAKSLGVSVGDLTDSQRAQALAAATLDKLKAELKAAGPAALDFGDNIKRGQVFVENLTNDLGEAIATSPVLKAAFDSIGTALQDAFGGKQQSTVQILMEWVNKFAIGLTYAGQAGTVAATVLVTVWYAVKTAILAVLTAVTAVGTGLVGFVAGVAELGSHIPIVGEKVKGFAEGANALAQGLLAATGSMAEQTAEAAKGVVGNSDLHRTIDKVGGALIVMREKMTEALGAEALLLATTVDTTNGLADTGDAAELTAAQIKAMEDATRAGQEAIHDMAEEAAEKFRALQEEMTLANMTGLERRLADIEVARQKEIAGLQFIAFAYPAMYEEMVAMVTEKHGQMTAAALQSFADQAGAAASAGATTRAEGEKNLAAAKKAYAELQATGKATFQQLQTAHAAVKKAEMDLDALAAAAKMKQFEMIASSAAGILRSLFGKSKAAAIAAAIIDTFAAIAKTLAAYPWPFNLIPAAAAAAAGWAQVNAIRSTDAGFAQGTPGMGFEDFGRGTATVLHGDEAVVTRGQGEGLADMVLNAVRQGQGDGGEKVTHVVLQLDGRMMAEWWSKMNRTGHLAVG
jgi:hypothetical protein